MAKVNIKSEKNTPFGGIIFRDNNSFSRSKLTKSAFFDRRTVIILKLEC